MTPVKASLRQQKLECQAFAPLQLAPRLVIPEELVMTAQPPHGSRTRTNEKSYTTNTGGPSTCSSSPTRQSGLRAAILRQGKKGGAHSGKPAREEEGDAFGLTTGRSGGQHTHSPEPSWRKCLPSLRIWFPQTFISLERGGKKSVPKTTVKGELFLLRFRNRHSLGGSR